MRPERLTDTDGPGLKKTSRPPNTPLPNPNKLTARIPRTCTERRQCGRPSFIHSTFMCSSRSTLVFRDFSVEQGRHPRSAAAAHACTCILRTRRHQPPPPPCRSQPHPVVRPRVSATRLRPFAPRSPCLSPCPLSGSRPCRQFSAYWRSLCDRGEPLDRLGRSCHLLGRSCRLGCSCLRGCSCRPSRPWLGGGASA